MVRLGYAVASAVFTVIRGGVMHEWGLARRLVQLIENEAQARQLTQVKQVFLETGVLSAAEREALCFNFCTAAQGTIAQNAVLEIKERPTPALCPSCLVEVLVTKHDQTCPHCQTTLLNPSHSDSLRLTELVAT